MHDHRFIALTKDPVVRPFTKARENRQQGIAFRRQAVLETRTVNARIDSLEDALFDQVTQAFAQHIPRDAQLTLEIGKTAGPEKRVPNDEQSP